MKPVFLLNVSGLILLKERLPRCQILARKNLITIADNLVKKSVWIVGGDGWAYDIGYGASIMYWHLVEMSTS